MTPLTMRRLRAMSAALSAMAAGEPNAGDWPEEVTPEDLDAAEMWVAQEMRKREERAKR